MLPAAAVSAHGALPLASGVPPVCRCGDHEFFPCLNLADAAGELLVRVAQGDRLGHTHDVAHIVLRASAAVSVSTQVSAMGAERRSQLLRIHRLDDPEVKIYAPSLIPLFQAAHNEIRLAF
jgi:hypothetical protein